MDDEKIIELYWLRKEKAVSETKNKYGRLIAHIVRQILPSAEDGEEAENDTYLRVWNAIPTDRPKKFMAYLSKIARRAAVDIYRRLTAEKRGGSEYAVAIEELSEILPDAITPEKEFETAELAKVIDAFLETLRPTDRKLFVKRYFYNASIRQISVDLTMTESNVKTTLFRLRQKLKDKLSEEGYL